MSASSVTRIDEAQLRKLFQQGLSIEVIANRLGHSHRAVWNKLSRMGLITSRRTAAK